MLNAVAAFALGCDMINVGREAMMAIGCIQAQECHTGHCPTGVATHSRWLTHGLDPTSKAVRVANYVTHLRYELLRLAQATGVPHPALIPQDAVEIALGSGKTSTLTDQYDLPPTSDRLHASDLTTLEGPLSE